MNILICLCFAGLGGALRYLAVLTLNRPAPHFPWGTLCVNVLGSGVLGWSLVGVGSVLTVEGRLYSTGGAMIWLICFSGGLTTFSTFIQELFEFHQRGYLLRGVVYLSLSLVLSLGITWVVYARFV